MLKSVWVVTWHDYDWTQLIAAYPEKEVAEQHAREANEKAYQGCDQFQTQEIPFVRHYDEFLDQQGD